MKHEIKPVATFGDLVTADGYGSHLFAVDEYYYEYRYSPTYSEVSVIYDLTCVYGNSGYIIGEQEDLTLICREAQADAFLQTYKPAQTVEDKPSILRSIYFAIGNGGEEMSDYMTKQPKLKKVPTKQERIDALLDERKNVGSSDDFVKVADPEAYKQRRYNEIDAKLRELTAE